MSLSQRVFSCLMNLWLSPGFLPQDIVHTNLTFSLVKNHFHILRRPNGAYTRIGFPDEYSSPVGPFLTLSVSYVRTLECPNTPNITDKSINWIQKKDKYQINRLLFLNNNNNFHIGKHETSCTSLQCVFDVEKMLLRCNNIVITKYYVAHFDGISRSLN